MNTLLTLFDLERYKAHTRDGFWRDDTVYALARGHAERTPDRVAVRTAFGVLTYADLIRAADAFATDLTMRGVRPGQRVAVWLPSRAETVVALLACSRGGFVCCPSLHRDHTVADIVSLLRRMRATALVVERGYGADADSHDISRLRRTSKRSTMFMRWISPFPATASSRTRPPAPTCRRAHAIPIMCFISPSHPARPACPRASCTVTTRCSPTPARCRRTGISARTPLSIRSVR